MSKKIKPKKWTEVYTVGTKEGDEEARFFKVLARNPKFEWRSTSALSKESNLSKKRVEEIILKYHKMGLVFQNPKNEEHWGYWERVPHMLPERKESISKSDKDQRIEKAIKKQS
jgi:hypothetical protein